MTDDIYGPQTEHIKAFVARIRVLTDDECKRLMNAWPRGYLPRAVVRIARYDAQDAVESATRDVAISAIRDAIRDATRDATRVGIQEVVADTALALVVRDLIGHYGFTHQHYNTLTGPWRTAIGSIHPDDDGVCNLCQAAAEIDRLRAEVERLSSPLYPAGMNAIDKVEFLHEQIVKIVKGYND